MVAPNSERASGFWRGGATASLLALANVWAVGCGGSSVNHTGSEPGGTSGSSGASAAGTGGSAGSMALAGRGGSPGGSGGAGTGGPAPDIDSCENADDCVMASSLLECCGCPVAMSRNHYEQDLCYWIRDEPRDIPDECAIPCPAIVCAQCPRQWAACTGHECMAYNFTER